MSDDATLDEFADSGQTETNQEVPPPTELIGVSDDWATVRLAEVAEGGDGAFVDGPFGSNLKADEMYGEGYARVIQLQNIRESEFVDTNHRYISEEKFRELSRHGAKAGDLAIAKMSEPVARACLLPDIEDQYLVVADCIKLSVDESAHNSQFVMLALNSRPVWKQAFARSRGSTRKRINLTQLKEVQIPSPPLSEQRKIATVLHTVDQAIQKTEQIVQQTERIEQGLLQTLFSGEHLDCEYQTEPTLGKIPEHWNICPMSEACNITMGSSPKSEYYNKSGEGLPFFQANNEFGLRNPTNDRWCSNPVKTAEKGDSLMTIRGTYVGQMNIANKECCIGRGLAGISAGKELHSEYLYHHLRRRERYVKSIAIGSTFDSVSSGDLDNLLIAVPPKNEQKEIADILQTVQQRIIFSEKYAERLGELKQGLMQDLLSGEVRTTDADIDIPEEVAKYG